MLTAFHSFKSPPKNYHKHNIYENISFSEWKTMHFVLIMVHFKHLPTSQTQTNPLTNSRLSARCHLLTFSSRGNSYRCSELLIQLSENLCEHAWVRQEQVRNMVLKCIFSVIWGETLTIHHTTALQTLLWELPLHTFYTLAYTFSLYQMQSRRVHT